MIEKEFSDIIKLIQQSRVNAIKAVNSELINLYWNVGAYISKRIGLSNWGEKTVVQLSEFIRKNHPELKGFNRAGLYRMKQFYETYELKEFVSPVVAQLQFVENEGNVIVSPAVRQLSVEGEFTPPTMVAEYKTQLPDKKLLQQKLHELFENSSEINK